MLLSHCASFFTRLHPSILSIAGVWFFSVALTQSSPNLDWIPFDRGQFDGNVALDPRGDVQLLWQIGVNYSTFGVASRSSGYLALGFSQTGAMTGGDIALGYNDENGKFVFENRYATDFVTPQVSPDQEKNMRLKEGSQANGVTSFIFEKQNKADCLKTQADVAVDAWQWFIYAFSDDNTFVKHAPGHNGKQYVKLGTGKTVSTNNVQPIDDTKNLTIVQPEVTVPTAETTYCYTLHKMPAGKGWLLGERPPQSSQLLHHLVFYACYDLDDKYLDMIGKEPNCNYKTFSNPCNGFVTEWAPGMSGRTFEPGYGKPFGTGHYEYVMLETHYNNPEHIEGQKDTTSYTFLWNDKPVHTEIGTLTLGDLQVEGWFLEPGKNLVKHSTVCTPECTDRWPSSDGITAVSVFHHMHYRGRNAEVQIIRDGKELAPLSTLRDFEYGYQFSKSLNSVKLLPGDKLITTCEFDTSNDTKPVPGGLSSEDEMCFAWVDYYPANNVLACTQINMGHSPQNQMNGTAALCLQSPNSFDVYESKFLESGFQHLPATGRNCTATSSGSNSTVTSVEATILKTCPETDVCFSINVPEQSANSGSGNIYFQLSAPTTYSWVGLAQGTMMSNANMFVMYSSADGQNVTLSPRTTSGHVMPTHNDAADISLLEGSGISNGRMVANVRCGNCNNWGTGSMSLQDSSSNWLYAYLQGSQQIDSDDLNAHIFQHQTEGLFSWDLLQATGGSDTNPFTGAASTSSSNVLGGQNSWMSLSSQVQDRFVQAHGALASIAFVLFLPMGGILVRLASFHHLASIHGALQIFGYVIFIAAAGIGIFIADGGDYLQEPHAVIGMLLLVVLFFMPFLGAIHHRVYKTVQRRTWWSYCHIFTGRAAIILGMVNGGLGLQLADAHDSNTIAYGVFAGVMGVLYIGVIIFDESKHARKSSPEAATFFSTSRESKPLYRDDSGSESSR